MRVKMLPADQYKANPYPGLLAASLRKLGVEVRPGNTVQLAFEPSDIVHVHWPTNYASVGALPKAMVLSALLLLLCAAARLRGAKVIWTVHEIASLRPNNVWLESVLMAGFTRMTDGLIYPNETCRADLEQARPYMRHLPSALIPHGLHGTEYPPPGDTSAIRRAFDLPDDAFVIACPGDIKPYKNIESLVDAAGEIGQSNLVVLLSGRCGPPNYTAELQARVAAACEKGACIVWIDRRPSDAEMAACIDASDAVALPYTRTWSSGMAILALERGRRLLTSGASSFKEVGAEAGPYWAEVADGTVAAADLERLMRRTPTADDRDRLAAFLARREWPEIARRHLEFYRRMTA